jgi:hypothetical protein
MIFQQEFQNMKQSLSCFMHRGKFPLAVSSFRTRMCPQQDATPAVNLSDMHKLNCFFIVIYKYTILFFQVWAL